MAGRSVYVLMWNTDSARARAGAWFATSTRKRSAIRRAKEINRDAPHAQATVYAIPYPGSGWDCPTIRATFDPIYRAGQ